jgi:hypothetical protein
MSYFKNFPVINYSVDGARTAFQITDFFRRIKADKGNIETSLAYYEYQIRDGETPENLAVNIYGKSEYHWVLLIINEIIDPRWDWPMTASTLLKFVEEKYGQDQVLATHHYENADGDVVHVSWAGIKYSITNYDYEDGLNEARRTIKILKPRFLAEFVDDFMTKVKNG